MRSLLEQITGYQTTQNLLRVLMGFGVLASVVERGQIGSHFRSSGFLPLQSSFPFIEMLWVPRSIILKIFLFILFVGVVHWVSSFLLRVYFELIPLSSSKLEFAKKYSIFSKQVCTFKEPSCVGISQENFKDQMKNTIGKFKLSRKDLGVAKIGFGFELSSLFFLLSASCVFLGLGLELQNGSSQWVWLDQDRWINVRPHGFDFQRVLVGGPKFEFDMDSVRLERVHQEVKLKSKSPEIQVSEVQSFHSQLVKSEQLSLVGLRKNDLWRYRILVRGPDLSKIAFSGSNLEEEIQLEEASFSVIEKEEWIERMGPAVKLRYTNPSKELETFWIFERFPDYDPQNRKESRYHFFLERLTKEYQSLVLVSKTPAKKIFFLAFLLFWGGLVFYPFEKSVLMDFSRFEKEGVLVMYGASGRHISSLLEALVQNLKTGKKDV